jgi:Ribonuclease G/E
VTVVKVPIKSGDKLVVSSKVRVVGKYAILGKGSGVSFSSFIRNKERISKLLEISADLIKEGYSIRWRSNADEADINNIIEELPELKKKFKEVENSLKTSEPLKIVYVGEYMSILELTYRSKMYLDEVRSTVASTTPYHHMLRTLNRDENIVDLLDIIAGEIGSKKLLSWLRQWMANKILERKEVILHHKRVFKKNVIIGRMQPREVASTPELLVKLRRTIKSKGVYDGLNISKDPGDYSLSIVREGEWHIRHEYFAKSGISKGTYFNINTPPEILPNGTIRYVDLEVDLVKTAGSGCKLIDSDGFRKLIAEQAITQEILENVVKEIERLISTYCSLAK